MTTRRKIKLYSKFDKQDDSMESAILRIASDIALTHSNRRTPLLNVNDAAILNIVVYILNKKTRSKNELSILQCVLESFDSLMQAIRNADSIKEMVSNIALVLTYEEHQGQELLFRFGESGDKFYIVLKGKVAVMLPKEFTVAFDFLSYIKYLTYLFYIKEKELLINIIISNIDVFYIEKDTFLKQMAEYKSLLLRKRDVLLNKYKFVFLSQDQHNELSLFIHKVFAYCNTSPQVTNSDEYIQLVFPNVKSFHSANYANEHKENVVLLTYTKISTLGIGDSFGEIALQQRNKNIRTASVIVNEHSVFAVLNKETYSKCIREYQKKQRLLKLKFFSELTLFTNVSHRNFELKYFNYFLYKNIPLNSIIIQQGDRPTKVYIIRSGTFEITSFMSYDFLNTIYTSKTNRNLNKVFSILNDDQMKIKQSMRITILNANDVVGLDDIMYEGKYFVNVKCISKESEVYIVDYEYLKNMIDNSLTLRNNFDKAMSIRNGIICKRMEDIAMYLNCMQKENYRMNMENDPIKRIFTNRECKHNGKYSKGVVLKKNTFSSNSNGKEGKKLSGNVNANIRKVITKIVFDTNSSNIKQHVMKHSDNIGMITPTHVNTNSIFSQTHMKAHSTRSKFLSYEKMLKTIVGPKLRRKGGRYGNDMNSKGGLTLSSFQSLHGHEDSSIGIKRVLFLKGGSNLNVQSYTERMGCEDGRDGSERRVIRKSLIKKMEEEYEEKEAKRRKGTRNRRYKYPVKAYLLRPLSCVNKTHIKFRSSVSTVNV